MKNRNTIFTAIPMALGFLALLPLAQAVVPAPDGGYPGGNTAEGQSALFSLTTGGFNTAVGLFSLRSNTTGSFNTAIGAGALLANTENENTATGAGALLSNSTGYQNTADGAFALVNNTSGAANSASGDRALYRNTSGGGNTASGEGALYSNTTGGSNTAIGTAALAVNSTGSGNIALGQSAGSGVSTGNNVICIGADGNNVDNRCFIGNIFGSTSPNGIGVLVNSNGRLDTTTSSKRFKEDIKPIDNASEALFALKPVTFHYKKEIDPQAITQFGLVAEDVEQVNPDLVVRDKEGKPYSVRYDQVNAMLLNEFLKEHKTVQELRSTVHKQEAIIAQQQKSFESKLAEEEKQIEALASGLQKVSAEVEVNRPRRQVVINGP